jgi:MFS family permease
VLASFGIAIAAFGVGFAPAFGLVLVSLLAIGTSDGLTMVAETGIMQRRTPDVVRSRVMAAFEAVVSFGLAAAYIAAGPVLKALGPQPTYRLGGVSALAAALLLLPLLALRRSAGSGPDDPAAAVELEERLESEEPLGEVLTGSPRYTSAESLESEPFEPEPFGASPDRRTA